MSQLTNKNFDLYAARHYTNPRCLSIEEFKEDLSRFKVIKRLLKRYYQKGLLEERRLLNEIIIIHNVFFINAAVNMCFNRIDEKYWPALKTCLLYLNFITDDDYINIPIDLLVAAKLQRI